MTTWMGQVRSSSQDAHDDESVPAPAAAPATGGDGSSPADAPALLDSPPGMRRPRSFAPVPPRRPSVSGRLGRSAARGFWSLLFPPAFAWYLLRELVLDARDAIDERRIALGHKVVDPDPHPFARSHAMPPRAEASVADIVGQIDSFPFRTGHLRDDRSFLADGANDGVAVLATSRHQLNGLPHLYPQSFQPRLFTGAHGAQVAAFEGIHHRDGPALVICHGLATNKSFDYVRRIALRAYHRWGFHVVVVDLRGHGQTSWTAGAPSSVGYYEGADVVAIARELKRDPRVTSVGAMGFSLGGCTVLNAARHASLAPDDPLDGGVMSLSAPSEMYRATRYVSRRPPVRHPFFVLWMIFWAGMRVAVRDRRLDARIRDWMDVIRAESLPFYGVSEEEFFARASAVNWASEVTVPTLAVHADDDFVVPVDHAHALAEAAADNPSVAVRTVPQGSHCSFGAVDDRWFRSVVRRWFEYWATPPTPVRPVTPLEDASG